MAPSWERAADFEARRAEHVRHVPVDPDPRLLANGKVAGVLTGVRVASSRWLVIADDDVRYDESGLMEVQRSLEHADIVRPQNYFDPLRWHAYLDTARTLINRVTGGDWPGTFGVRRQALQATGGYDGNVLFENLGSLHGGRGRRTRASKAGCVRVRRPPHARVFWSQRIRQAFDEFARPRRMLAWLALLPATAWVILRFRWNGAAAVILMPMMLAETGRRVDRGTAVFPLGATLMAPLWMLERGVCAWLAVAARVLLGGVPYRGRVLKRAATSPRVLCSSVRQPSDRVTEARRCARAPVCSQPAYQVMAIKPAPPVDPVRPAPALISVPRRYRRRQTRQWRQRRRLQRSGRWRRVFDWKRSPCLPCRRNLRRRSATDPAASVSAFAVRQFRIARDSRRRPYLVGPHRRYEHSVYRNHRRLHRVRLRARCHSTQTPIEHRGCQECRKVCRRRSGSAPRQCRRRPRRRCTSRPESRSRVALMYPPLPPP